MKNILFLILSCVILSVGCGTPTYVVQQPINQPQAVVETIDPLYDAALTMMVLNGQQGYYDHTHLWHTMVVRNGYHGYYDSRNRFVSADDGVRIAVQQHRPIVINKTVINNTPVNTPVNNSSPKGSYLTRSSNGLQAVQSTKSVVNTNSQSVSQRVINSSSSSSVRSNGSTNGYSGSKFATPSSRSSSPSSSVGKRFGK